MSLLDPNSIDLLDRPALLALDRAALTVLAAEMQGDPKKQGKEKKPDENLVGLVSLVC